MNELKKVILCIHVLSKKKSDWFLIIFKIKNTIYYW